MQFELHQGDCIEVLRAMPDNSVDSIVTDPPYGLKFMAKHWDYDVPGVDAWAECLRVLKPGGHLLAFAGTRTQHRMAVNIEDAGFEIRDMVTFMYSTNEAAQALIDTLSRDQLKLLDATFGRDAMVAWVYGSGFPKSHNGEWGGTALKPALEPITFARKPLIGTVEQNWREHGTGGLSIDACRVAAEAGGRPLREVAALRDDVQYSGNALAGRVDGSLASSKAAGSTDIGRWPANLIHDGSDDVLAAFPDAPGQQANVSTTAPSEKTSNVYGRMKREGEASADNDNDNDGIVGFKMKPGARRLDKGSAARFFYCAKASKTDRGASNDHPTVKPTDLMRHLVRLVTPSGGVVLDPFMGSGSTGKGAMLEGFRFIGIERETEHIEIANARILKAQIEAFDAELSTSEL